MAEGKAGFHDKKHTWQSGLTNGKLEPETPAAQPPIRCPECTSQKVWKDGIRYTWNGEVQRYLCRSCGFRFSEPNVKVHITSQIGERLKPRKNHSETSVLNGDCPVEKAPDELPFIFGEDVGSHSVSSVEKGLNSLCFYNSKRRVCETDGDSKNLAEVQTQEKAQRESTATDKGEIIDFAWKMQKEGYSQETIMVYSRSLKWLMEKGAKLLGPENVKEVLAKQNASEARKHVVISAYTLFLEMQGLHWKPPICNVTRQLPFIPTERELDDLIAGCGRKTSIFLQLLKETAMRVGEASKLKWTHVDLQRRIITLNTPEKKGFARVFNISGKLVDMLASLPRKTEYVFGSPSKISRSTAYYKQRKQIAHKLGNPRLRQIGFHTFRHWKATMLYHETKDPMLVKEFLGHRNLDTTLLYIQLEKALFKTDSDEFTVKAVREPEEIQALLEVGFEYVCQKDGLMFFRKRK